MVTTTHNGNFETYLTLGEGDFSFSADLSKHLSERSTTSSNRPNVDVKTRLLATGFDQKEEVLQKYRDFDSIQKRICSMQNSRFQVQILHGVNAIVVSPSTTENSTSSALPAENERRADYIFFNHPHLGTEDATLHGYFTHHLFDSIRNKWLAKDAGLFILTLVDGQFERWRCQEAAQKHMFILLGKYRFVPGAVNDCVYELRRHQTGRSFRSRSCGSFSYVFARSEDIAPPITVISDLPWFQDTNEKDSTGKREDKQIEMHFSCPHCERKFREDRSVKNHILSKHRNVERRKHECLLCEEPRIFESESALRDHQQAKHQGIHRTILPDWASNNNSRRSSALGQCFVCACTFSQSFGQEEHLASFLPRPPKQVPCRFCTKLFGSERAKNQHENYCSQI